MTYNWTDRTPHHISLEELTADEQYKLIKSDVFCILPWIHLSIEPNGTVLPCCIAKATVGNTKNQTLREIWNNEPMAELRRNMLADTPSVACQDCYEHESTGIRSLRNGCNRAYGHNIKSLVDSTQPSGQLPQMELRYWDVRFSNICNLKCRMCSSKYSSRWAEDDAKLWGRSFNPVILFPGQDEDDVWNQIQEHIPYVESIYFAGGEPLIMEQHNRLLRQLIEKGNTKVHLTYATNLTELKYKNSSVLDLWRHFPKVGVTASLDDMSNRASVIRSGTDWADIEQNIRDLKRECPHIDLMIGPTVSIMNIWNICKFHRYMVDQGLIEAKDFNLNLLQHPHFYRIDIIPVDIKLQLKQEIEQHLEWLRPIDTLQRATSGFEGVIQLMMSADNSAYLSDFWKATEQLDAIRSEKLIDVVPELKQIQ